MPIYWIACNPVSPQSKKQMKISNVGANQTECTLPNGNVILISYDTPVAIAYKQGNNVSNINIDSGKWSKTTNKHIDKFLARNKLSAFCANVTKIPNLVCRLEDIIAGRGETLDRHIVRDLPIDHS